MIFTRADISENKINFYRIDDKFPIHNILITPEFRDITIHKISGSSLSMVVFIFETEKMQILVEDTLKDNILVCVGTILVDLIEKNNQSIIISKKNNVNFKNIKKNIGLESL